MCVHVFVRVYVCVYMCVCVHRYVMSDLDINKHGHRYRRSEINRSVLHFHE